MQKIDSATKDDFNKFKKILCDKYFIILESKIKCLRIYMYT